MKICQATWADVAGIRALEIEVPEAPHWTNEQYEAMLANETSALLLVAAEKDAILGFAAVNLIRLPDESFAQLESVMVSGKSRRRGLGRALLQTVLAWAEEQGARWMELEVRASNLPARGLYRELGFEEQGHRKNYYRNPIEDAVLFSKKFAKTI